MRYYTLIVLLILSNRLFAYDFKIEGNVYTTNNQAVGNIRVYFFSTNGLSKGYTTTDANGYYSKTLQISEQAEKVIIAIFEYCNNQTTLLDTLIQSYDGTFQKSFITNCLPDQTPDCLSAFRHEINQIIGITNFVSLSNYDPDTWLWDFGDGATSTETNPSHYYTEDGFYNVCLTTKKSEECLANYCKKIQYGAVYKISGIIFISGNKLPNGKAILINKNLNYKITDNTEITNGYYSFTDVFQGQYLIYFIPIFDFEFPYFPKYLPVYYGDKLHWSNSELLYINTSIYEIPSHLQSYYEIFYGHGKISGKILLNPNANENEKISIILYNNAQEPITFTLTDNNGLYEIKDLPFGTYTVYPEKAGYTTIPAIIEISDKQPEIENINFAIENGYIKVGIDDKYQKIKVFPTLVNNTLNIQMSENIPEANIQITDILGKKIIDLKAKQSNITIDLSTFKSGYYILSIYSNKRTIYRTKISKE